MSTSKDDNGNILIGSRLKHIRKLRNFTQDDMAKILKVSKGYICKIEKNEREPGPYVKDAIEEFLKPGGPDNLDDAFRKLMEFVSEEESTEAITPPQNLDGWLSPEEAQKLRTEIEDKKEIIAGLRENITLLKEKIVMLQDGVVGQSLTKKNAQM